MSQPAKDKSKDPNKAETTGGSQEKKRSKISSTGKALAELSQQDLTRTHKAFGLFPNALLLFGYGENKNENERIITTEEKNLKTGELITRQMKIYTNSAKGLPRGRDPQVLIALLHLTLQKPGSTNSIWFRKEDLIKTLGWVDNQENRQDIDEAISRYFEAAYSGLDIKVNAGGKKIKEKFSRIITDYINIDERKIRYNNDQKLFSKVVFNEELINEIRSAELSLHLNLKIIQLLQKSPTALRLYEVINYLTSSNNLRFEIEIKELAHNRVGISRSKKSPAQILQTLQPAADKLVKIGYLKTFNYNAGSGFIEGEVNSMMASPLTTGLGPLPDTNEKRRKIIHQFVQLGSYLNPTTKIINSLPEDLLDDAEIIYELVAREKNEAVFGPRFGYGGRALKNLQNLQATGEISQSLLERSQLNTLPVQKEIPESLDSENVSLPEDFEFEEKNTVNVSSHKQLNLPISISAIQEINPEAEELWAKCFDKLRRKVSEKVLQTWFSQSKVTPLRIEDNNLIMQADDQNTLNWIEATYSTVIRQSIDEATQTHEQWNIKWIIN